MSKPRCDHCPMAPGGGADWLQATRDIANPYYATAMKSCGEGHWAV